jgi:hypothetical protein
MPPGCWRPHGRWADGSSVLVAFVFLRRDVAEEAVEPVVVVPVDPVEGDLLNVRDRLERAGDERGAFPDGLVLEQADHALDDGPAGVVPPPWDSHLVRVQDLNELLEQLVIQLHDFPAQAQLYRPQISEPVFEPGTETRLIIGLSGSGKTAWASQAASLIAMDVAYYDVGFANGDALAFGLA